MHETLTGFFLKHAFQYITVFQGQPGGFSELDPEGLAPWKCLWFLMTVRQGKILKN